MGPAKHQRVYYKPLSESFMNNRRNFLQLGVLGMTGMTLSSFRCTSAAAEQAKAKQAAATADSVIFINLAGGPSHLDTLDMKPDGPSETRGEFQPISSAIPSLAICEHLPKLAKVIDRFTLLRGISHTAGAHPQGQSWISTGNRPTPAIIYPSFGSVVGKELGGTPDLPPYVAIPVTEWNAGYMGDSFAPFKTNAIPKQGQSFGVRGIALGAGLTIEKVNRRQQLLNRIDQRFRDADTNSQLLDALDEFGKQAHDMITSKRSREAFDVSLEPASIKDRFADDELNQSCLLACRLVEFGAKFININNAGWDTHLDNFKGHVRLMGPLDNALPALIAALKEKGLLDRTLVVAMGEFGRTPKINVNTGRDHFPRASWSLLAGGGVKAGQLIGATNSAGDAPTDDTNISPDDIAATIYSSLGIDPRTEYLTKTGRPVMLVPHGNVMSEVFG
ncbi:MAG: hypothetical protein ACI9G1_000965 [Pirellulaceae bacterium]